MIGVVQELRPEVLLVPRGNKKSMVADALSRKA